MANSLASLFYANIRDMVASPYYRNTRFNNVQQALVTQLQAKTSYQKIFGNLEDGAIDPDRSLISPAAYFVDLMRLIETTITAPHGNTLRDRRPDLWDNIGLDRENTEIEVPYLHLVNTVLAAKLGIDVKKPEGMLSLAMPSYPMTLPYNAPLQRIRMYLKHFKTDLATLFTAIRPKVASNARKTVDDDAIVLSIAREQLGISKEEFVLITTPITQASDLNALYGMTTVTDSSLGGLDQVETFMAQTGLNRKQVDELIYQGLSEDEKKETIYSQFFINGNGERLSISAANAASEQIISVKSTILEKARSFDRLNRFIHFANKLGWSFADLDWALCSYWAMQPENSSMELDTGAVQALALMKQLQERLHLPLDVVCSFYGDLKSIGKGNGPTPQDLFDRVFSTNPPAQSWTIENRAGIDATVRSWLLAALKISDDDLTLLASRCIPYPPHAHLPIQIPLDKSHLTLLYRGSKIASCLGLRVNEYVLFLDLLQGMPSRPPIPALIRLVDAVRWMQNAGLTVYQLQYMLLGVSSPYANSGYSESDLNALVSALQQLPQNSDPPRVNLQENTNPGLEVVRPIIPTAALIGKLTPVFKTDSATLEQLLRLSFKMAGNDLGDLNHLLVPHSQEIEIVARTLLLAKLLKLTAQEIQAIREHPDWFGIQDTLTDRLLFTDFQELYCFKQIIQAFHDTNNQVLGYFGLDEQDAEGLHQITGWDKTQLETLIGDLQLTTLASVQSLAQLKAYFDTAQYLGVDIPFLQSLAELSQVPPLKKNGGENQAIYTGYLTIADNLLKTIRARHDSDQWDALSTAMTALSNEQDRDAMAGLLLQQLKPPATLNDVYGYLLMDVEMGGCMNISPIKLGINTLQLYIQRCRLGLESGVQTTQTLEQEWSWMSHYSLWAANRKVFLYPENYVDPSLRKQPTPLYTDLKNQLLQNDITSATVEKAYNTYFDAFEELARLTIVDCCYGEVNDKVATVFDPDHPSAAKTLFFMGRTKTTPYTYYYRTAILTSATIAPSNGTSDASSILWNPWQKIELSIKAEEVSIIYAFHKLFVFWVEQTSETHSTSSGGSGATKVKASIKYSFQNISHEWVKPQTLLKDVTIHDDADTSTNWLKFTNSEYVIWNRVSLLTVVGQPAQAPAIPDPMIVVLFGGVDHTYTPFLPLTALTSQLTSKTLYASLSEEVMRAIQKNGSNRWSFTDPTNPTVSVVGGIHVGITGPFPLNTDTGFPGGAMWVPTFENPDGKSENYIAMPGVTLPEDFTLEAWISLNQGTAGGPILSKPPDLQKKDNAYAECNLQVSGDGNLSFFMGNGDKGTTYGINLLGPSISVTAWHHVAVTMQHNSAILYMDGQPVRSGTFTNGTRQKGSSPLLVGHYYNESEQWWPGKIADVWLWNRALSPDEIKRRHDSKNNPLLRAFSSYSYTVTGQPSWSIWDSGQETFLVIPAGKFSQPPTAQLPNSSTPSVDFDQQPPDVAQKVYMRLSTRAIDALSQKMFAGGLDDLLTSDMQKTLEYPFGSYGFDTKRVILPGDTLDFSGAYGPYYWEIFFHIPFLIANTLNTNQHFEEAQRWYHYIFNPTAQQSPTRPPTNNSNLADQFWKFLPFQQLTPAKLQDILGNQAQLWIYAHDPFDPDAIARLRLVAYAKAIVMKYLDNLLDWGDQLFAQDGWEALVQATLCYIQADDLLGKKPGQTRLPDKTPSKTYSQLSSHNLADEATITFKSIDGVLYLLGPAVGLKLDELSSRSSAAVLPMTTPAEFDIDYFEVDENEVFAQYWEQVDNRLYKIRTCMNINGVIRQPGVYEPAIDPRQIMGVSGGQNSLTYGSAQDVGVPHYRFSSMLERAKTVASFLIELGANFLGTLEKRDGEELALRHSLYEQQLLNLMTQIKEGQIQEEQQNMAALQQSLESANYRYKYYSALISAGLSAGETVELLLIAEAIAAHIGSLAFKEFAIEGYLIPTIFGLADGGFHPGDAIKEAGAVLESLANIYQQGAGMSATIAQYQRRQQEWELQQALAQYDQGQIAAQIQAATLRQANAEQELAVHKQTTEQAKEIHDFLQGKFTHQDLYEWMIRSLSDLFFQTYQIALGLAKAAERAYQFELNTYEDTIIQDGYWDSLKKGLLAGEGLMLGLNTLEKKYLDGNARVLEIEKTISLLQLAPDQFFSLKTMGACTFSLNELLFDQDFPGHYCRKIKSIAITLPAIVGPYQNIQATLTQTGSRILVSADSKGVQALLSPGTELPSSVKSNVRPNQQIAISHGVSDSGMFELNFTDERYLPFEGTGAISDWKFLLPKATNRSLDFNSITDVIIDLKYTALDGGEGFRTTVSKLNPVSTFDGYRLISLANEFPSDWLKLKSEWQTPEKVPFSLSANKFPLNLTLSTVKIAYIFLLPSAGNGHIMKGTGDAKTFDQNKNIQLTVPADALKSQTPDAISDMLLILQYEAKLDFGRAQSL